MVPLPNTLLSPAEPNVAAAPNAGAEPNVALPPNAGGEPNAGAAPKPPENIKQDENQNRKLSQITG